MEARCSRLPLAILVAVVAAGAATVLLRPRSDVIEPASVDVKAYFSPAQLDRAEDFRSTQRLLGAGRHGARRGPRSRCSLCARRARVFDRLGPAAAPRRGRGRGRHVARCWWWSSLPLDRAWRSSARATWGSRPRAWGPWAEDVVKSAGVSAVFAGVGGALAMALVRRFPRRWWAPGSVAVVAHRRDHHLALPGGHRPALQQVRQAPSRRAAQPGARSGAARRTWTWARSTGWTRAAGRPPLNAYVNGLGHSKRVVLYDNLINDLPRDQVLQVVAHELGHQRHSDLLRGLAWLALVAPAGTRARERARASARARARPGRSAPRR